VRHTPPVETFLAVGFVCTGLGMLWLAVRLYRLSGVTEHLEARLANAREHRPPPEGLLGADGTAPRFRDGVVIGPDGVEP
jgi:hypothetical protein